MQCEYVFIFDEQVVEVTIIITTHISLHDHHHICFIITIINIPLNTDGAFSRFVYKELHFYIIEVSLNLAYLRLHC